MGLRRRSRSKADSVRGVKMTIEDRRFLEWLQGRGITDSSDVARRESFDAAYNMGWMDCYNELKPKKKR